MDYADFNFFGSGLSGLGNERRYEVLLFYLTGLMRSRIWQPVACVWNAAPCRPHPHRPKRMPWWCQSRWLGLWKETRCLEHFVNRLVGIHWS